MLALLLQTATRQVTSSISAQPPTGFPEWVKILITATAGSFVGFLSSVFLEFLKPFIAKRVLRRTVKKHLLAEVRHNTGILELVFRFLDNARGKEAESYRGALGVALRFIPLVSSDRYIHYFGEAKDIVYALDPEQSLKLFYQVLAERFPPAKARTEYTFGQVYTDVSSALNHARTYLKVKGEYPIPGYIPELELAYLDVNVQSDEAGMKEKLSENSHTTPPPTENLSGPFAP